MSDEAPPPPPPTGQRLPDPPAPGPGDRRLLLVGDWLTDTTRSLVHGFGDFFAVLTIMSLISTIISAPLLWISASDVILRRDGSGGFTSVDGLRAQEGALIALSLGVVFTAQLLLFSAATNHVERVRSGEIPRWPETFRLMLARGPRVIGVVMQVVALAFVALILSGLLGAVGLAAVAGLVAVGVIVLLWIRSAVACTYAALGVPGGSLAASFAWSKGLTWPLLGRHVLLGTIVLGVLLISSFLAAPFQSLSGAAASAEGDVVVQELIGSSFPAFVAVQFINALASGLAAALWASGMLSLYRSEPVQP